MQTAACRPAGSGPLTRIKPRCRAGRAAAASVPCYSIGIEPEH